VGLKVIKDGTSDAVSVGFNVINDGAFDAVSVGLNVINDGAFDAVSVGFNVINDGAFDAVSVGLNVIREGACETVGVGYCEMVFVGAIDTLAVGERLLSVGVSVSPLVGAKDGETDGYEEFVTVGTLEASWEGDTDG
jgi:phage head maturation protease